MLDLLVWLLLCRSFWSDYQCVGAIVLTIGVYRTTSSHYLLIENPLACPSACRTSWCDYRPVCRTTVQMLLFDPSMTSWFSWLCVEPLSVICCVLNFLVWMVNSSLYNLIIHYTKLYCCHTVKAKRIFKQKCPFLFIT